MGWITRLFKNPPPQESLTTELPKTEIWDENDRNLPPEELIQVLNNRVFSLNEERIRAWKLVKEYRRRWEELAQRETKRAERIKHFPDYRKASEKLLKAKLEIRYLQSLYEDQP